MILTRDPQNPRLSTDRQKILHEWLSPQLLSNTKFCSHLSTGLVGKWVKCNLRGWSKCAPKQIQDGGRWKIKKLRYLCNRLTDSDEIWHADASRPSWPNFVCFPYFGMQSTTFGDLHPVYSFVVYRYTSCIPGALADRLNDVDGCALVSTVRHVFFVGFDIRLT